MHTDPRMQTRIIINAAQNLLVFLVFVLIKFCIGKYECFYFTPAAKRTKEIRGSSLSVEDCTACTHVLEFWLQPFSPQGFSTASTSGHLLFWWWYRHLSGFCRFWQGFNTGGEVTTWFWKDWVPDEWRVAGVKQCGWPMLQESYYDFLAWSVRNISRQTRILGTQNAPPCIESIECIPYCRPSVQPSWKTSKSIFDT